MADGATAGEIEGVGPPHNIEAEQALLGALLVNNDVFDRVAAIVQAAHFYEPGARPHLRGRRQPHPARTRWPRR